MTDLTELDRLYAAAIDRMPAIWKSHCILPPEHATRLHTIQDDGNPPCHIVADKLYPRHGEWLVALHNAYPALAAELRALRELEKAAIAVCGPDSKSMFGDETDDPQCCDPYIVDRALFGSMRNALQSVERARSGR